MSVNQTQSEGPAGDAGDQPPAARTCRCCTTGGLCLLCAILAATAALAVTAVWLGRVAESVADRAARPAGGEIARFDDEETAKPTASAFLRVAARKPRVAFPPTEAFSEKAFDVYKKTQIQYFMTPLVLAAALGRPELTEYKLGEREDDPIEWLQRELRVTFPGDAEIMEVSLAADDPQEAAAVVNAVVNAYLTEVVEVEQMQRRKRLDELQRVFVQKKTSLTEKRNSLKRYARQVGTSDAKNVTVTQRMHLEELGSLRAQWMEIQRDGRLASAELEGQKARLKAVGEAEIPQTRRAEIEADIRRLEVLIAALQQQEDKLEQEAEAKSREIERLGGSSVEIEMMQAEIEYLDRNLTTIGEERERLEVELRAVPRVTLFQPAHVPQQNVEK